MELVFPKPKKDPLKDFPEKLKRKSQSIVIGKNEQKSLHISEGVHEIAIQIKDNSSLNLHIEGSAAHNVFSKIKLRVSVGANGQFKLIEKIQGGSRIDTECVVELSGEGAEANVIGRFHGQKDEHHGFFIIMQHASPNTRGNIALRGVYEGYSRAVFSGLIKVEKNAQKTNSYFRDDVLLLDQALAESLPTLEIEANDVKASHGSTTSRINSEQLFYLQSRGLKEQEAKKMIIEGFLEQ